MAHLSLVQTLWAGQLPNFSQTARMEIDPADGALLIHDPVSGSLSRAALGPGPLAPGDFRREDRSQPEDAVVLDFKGTPRSLDRATLERVFAEGSGSAYLDGIGFYGYATTLAAATLAGQDYLYLARKSGFGLEAYRRDGAALTPLQILGDTAESHLQAVTGMATLRAGGQDWLVAGSARENGLSLYRIGADGRLSHGSAFGFDERLPVSSPSGLTALELEGRSFVLMTAFGTSSLTVMELSGGTLVFRDQVNDSLATRFAGAAAMASHQDGDLALVALAGHDGGLSLLQLLPGGRLIHRETLVDSAATALSHVTALRFAQRSDGGVELLAFATGDGGLSRFALDARALGVSATGTAGSAGNDVLSAPAGGALLQAGAGADVLIDGAGADTLWGGSGADVFLLRPDGQSDRIGDFDPAEDRLDLSGFEALHDISGLGYRQTSGGAVLSLAGEELVVFTAGGGPLGRAALEGALMLAADHVLMPQPLPRLGGTGNDLFELGGQADTVDGGAGFDTVSYARAPAAVAVDLGAGGGMGGGASGDVLIRVEAVIGTGFNDVLSGDDGGNLLSGGAGHDTILGGGGADWITPGPGSNVIEGGAGRDMVSFVDLPDTPGRTNLDYRLDIDLAAGRAVSHDGSETTVLRGVERLTGSIYADRITGDAGDNELRGMGDYDWFNGSFGADSYDGGTGRDMVSYVAAPGAVTVDLGAGRGLAGMAAGDSYAHVERVTGSSHGDLFYGDAGPNDFRGLGGYDTFVGSAGGRERYDGGSGLDTVTYYQSAAGVTASLLLGYGSGGDASRDLYTSIENLTGSGHGDVLTGDHGRNSLRGLSGDDFLFGNGGVDRLQGGGGNDSIDGGAGSDYALFSGARAAYAVTRLDTDSVLVIGPEGRDQLENVEYFQFDDMVLRIWDL
jgi:Ca2+-binding RTX toxin-like protein